jgi:hypothetical protein
MISSGEHFFGRAFHAIQVLLQTFFEAESVGDDEVRLAHLGGLLRGDLERMRVSVRFHERCHIGLVGDEVLHDVAQDVRGHDDLRLLGRADWGAPSQTQRRDD